MESLVFMNINLIGKMKKIKKSIVALLLILVVFNACKKTTGNLIETKIINFENLTFNGSSYWDGSDGSGKFKSGNMTFDNNYNSTYGSWDSFVYSQLGDTVTPGYTNQYSVFDHTNGLNKFAIYYPPFSCNSFASFPNDSVYLVTSISVCNSTYAALSMKFGDAPPAKKFGGPSGNDPDWFKMTVIGFNAAGDSVKSVDFYLADYRFDNNSQDYIINKWTRVDLTPLGKINKLTFRLSSSDNGAWGMNTPSYVCLDNLKYEVVIPGGL